MYRAKERGRARYELFDEVMRGRAIDRLRMENDLRRALERDELELYYQPVVSLRDGSIVSVEALLRWRHPDRGLVLPEEFIPVAEEIGLIKEIGRWVLEHACAQGARWYASRPDAAPIGMSVNLSPVELAHGDLPGTVAALLRGTGLDASCLSLEITEHVLLEETQDVVDTLQALTAIGVRIVLDDFGTGYSSLAYLTRLPIDTLKIARSFVQGPSAERPGAVTEAIVSMARALSLEVVAEGVENETQVTELRRLGCDLAQGYHFSAPVPAEAITAMLQGAPPWLAERPQQRG
jgi:EAL domain-containing protein (putative c-di-GMP-specific phosphodiesterase class I)